jgi:RNA polymerase sigma factor (sigma-70 family)
MDGLYGYAMVLSRNHAVAADLVQEAYVRAIKAKESLRADSNVKSWLFTILRNIWLNQLRHERAAPKIAELDSDQNLAEVSVATSGDPHDLYVRKLERERVRRAIQQLPIEFREIVILREYEELWRAHGRNLGLCFPFHGSLRQPWKCEQQIATWFRRPLPALRLLLRLQVSRYPRLSPERNTSTRPSDDESS